MRFFKCMHCGNLVGMLHDSGVAIQCCGEPMVALAANSVEASKEKHLPVLTVNGRTVEVSVGSVAHPMIDTHFIEWIYLETKHGGQRKILHPGEAPTVRFALTEADEPIAAFAYCNLHGLWTTAL